MIPRKGYVTRYWDGSRSVDANRNCLIHKFITFSDEDGSEGGAIVEFEDGSCQTIDVEYVVFTEKYPGAKQI